MSTPPRDNSGELHDGVDPADDGAWARTLDAVYVALAEQGAPGAEPVDAGLRARLEREGTDALAGAQAGAAPVAGRIEPRRRAGWGAWAGWVAAAAVGMAFVIFAVPAGRGDTGRVVAQVDGASDAVSWPFAGTTEEFKGATGTVVWSSALQKGYMKLKGVPVNSPGASQYQLWIVDPQRDKNPVDGGVFDVAAGEVVVPIDAKLRVGRPAAFAITREKPGGVVVSAGPLLFVAKP